MFRLSRWTCSKIDRVEQPNIVFSIIINKKKIHDQWKDISISILSCVAFTSPVRLTKKDENSSSRYSFHCCGSHAGSYCIATNTITIKFYFSKNMFQCWCSISPILFVCVLENLFLAIGLIMDTWFNWHSIWIPSLMVSSITTIKHTFLMLRFVDLFVSFVFELIQH